MENSAISMLGNFAMIWSVRPEQVLIGGHSKSMSRFFDKIWPVFPSITNCHTWPTPLWKICHRPQYLPPQLCASYQM